MTDRKEGGSVEEFARILWDYHHLGRQVPTEADLLLVAGSHDLRVAERGAELAKSGVYTRIVVSGGAGKITASEFKEPEAVVFQRCMVSLGVPPECILIEPLATNSGQNIQNTKAILQASDPPVQTGLLVTKPYMERRLLATAQKQWEGVEWNVTSPNISFSDYPSTEVPWTRMVELMVGDFQRIKLYAQKGFQVAQPESQEAEMAYDALVSMGFDAQVTRESTSPS